MKSHRVDGVEVRVREYAVQDYDSLIQLWNDARLPYKPRGRDSREKIERELQGGSQIFLVAECAGRLVGSAFGTHDGRKGWINRVAVVPRWRRRGIARVLVREVEKRLEEAEIEIVAVLIEDWNVSSMEAFQRMGYVKHPEVVYFSKRANDNV